MMLTSELIIFFAFLTAGVICGVFFDFLRGTRKNFKLSDFAVYIEDIIFWIIIGGITLFTAYNYSTGEIRLYMLLAMTLGGIIYFCTFGKVIYKLFDAMCRYISRVISSITRLFSKEGKHEAEVKGI